MKVDNSEVRTYTAGELGGFSKSEVMRYQNTCLLVNHKVKSLERALSPYEGKHLFERNSANERYRGKGCIGFLKVYGDLMDSTSVGISLMTPGGKVIVDSKYIELYAFVEQLRRAVTLHPINVTYALGRGNTTEQLEKEYDMHWTGRRYKLHTS